MHMVETPRWRAVVSSSRAAYNRLWWWQWRLPAGDMVFGGGPARPAVYNSIMCSVRP